MSCPRDVLRAADDPAFEYEVRGGGALVVLCGGNSSRRWGAATRLRCTVLRDADPAAILFVEYDPQGDRFSLLRMRWSERLWSYCYADSVQLSEIAAAALGLRSANWGRALAYLTRMAGAQAGSVTPARVADRAKS
jgi:hypothetical protein